MSFIAGGLFKKGPNYEQSAEQAENARQARIREGQGLIANAFSGFNNDFYNQRRQAYTDYAMPQLASQYRQNLNQVNFNLANRGLLKSSAKQKQLSDLNIANQQGRQGIVDSAIAQAQQLQQQVEAAKNQQLSNLYASADPSSAGANAVSTAASFAQPSVMPALANQFAGLANAYYMSQLINAYRPTSFVSVPNSPANDTAVLGPTTITGGYK